MIEILNLKKSFGSHEVLKGINLTINQGEILFILGTSGTGKSVLLKLIVGLLPITSGEIKIKGQEISNLDEVGFQDIRKTCGMVFQQPALFDSLSIYDNVAFGLRRRFDLSPADEQIRVQESLELVHLSGVENKLPQQISYGMQKRASLARTLAVRPEVLLFDEPTTGLDPITTSAINQLIFTLSRKLKTTSIVVSHDMQCALDIADRIVVLDQGQIIAVGNKNEIKNSRHPLVQDFMMEVNNNV